MNEPSFPPIEALIEIHREMIAGFGGDPGIRDLGRLEAALDRGRNVVAYEEKPTVFLVAARIGHGVTRNHAFVDGNKRVGLQAIFITLRMNGYILDVSQREAWTSIEKIAEGLMAEAEIVSWLETNVIPAPEIL